MKSSCSRKDDLLQCPWPPFWPDLVLSPGDVHWELESSGWVHNDCSTGGGASAGGWAGIRRELKGRAGVSKCWGCGGGACSLCRFMTVHPQIFITSCIPTSNSAHNGHFATTCGSDMWFPWWLRQEIVHHAMQETWGWPRRGFFVRATHHSTQARNRKPPKSEALDSELLTILGLPLESPLWEVHGNTLCPKSYCYPWLFHFTLVWITSWRKQLTAQ